MLMLLICIVMLTSFLNPYRQVYFGKEGVSLFGSRINLGKAKSIGKRHGLTVNTLSTDNINLFVGGT